MKASDRARHATERALRLVAPWIVALDGLLAIGAGTLAVGGSLEGTSRGAEIPLLFGGLGLMLIGVLTVLRARLDLVRTGLAGVTAGFFAVQLSVFEAGTRRCDINETAPDCVGQIIDPAPYALFEAPMLLAFILFVFLIFEPLSRPVPAVVAVVESAPPRSPPPPPAPVVVERTAPPPIPHLLPATTEPAPRRRGTAAAVAVGAGVAAVLGLVSAVLAWTRRRR